MLIKVGSENSGKVQAVKELILEYDLLKAAEVLGVEVSSEVSSHPRSLDETISGAKNRARNAFSK